MKFIRYYITVYLLTVAWSLLGQHNFSLAHYTSDDGLSQNTITAMLKDTKGYLWLGTREGLNKFDGYNFTVFNSGFNRSSSMLSSRVRMLKEDQWGYIWIKTYDDIVYRLDPATENFIRITDETGAYIADKINDIFLLSSGDIWLTTVNNGCFRVSTHKKTRELSLMHLTKEENELSGNQVNDIFEDANANIWLLTNAGLTVMDASGKRKFHYEQQAFHTHVETDKKILFASDGKVILYDKKSQNFENKDLGHLAPVTSIAALSPHNFIVSTLGKGFYTYDILHNEWNRFSKDSYKELPTDHILNIYVDRAGEAWMQINYRGVIHFIPQTREVECLLSDENEGQATNPNYFIFEDENDLLWVQPYIGSFCWYDRVKKRLFSFKSTYNKDINALFDYGINHILPDAQGVFWLSTNRGNGFYKCTFLPDYFENYLFDNQSLFSISNETRCIFEDKDKRLWVACKDGRVHVFDENRKNLGILDANGHISSSSYLNVLVYNIFQDSKGDIWLATKKQGILRLKETGKNSFRIEKFMNRTDDPYSPGNDDFYSIAEDKRGRIWAGSYGAGLHLLEEKNGKIRFIHAKNKLKNYPIANCSRVRQIYPDSDGNIWIATTEGVVVFQDAFKNIEDISFNYIRKDKDQSNQLEANDIHCIYEDKDKIVWLATFGGGLNRLKAPYHPGETPDLQTFDHSNGMPNNIVYTILEDDNDHLWLTTENSIVKFNRITHEIESFGKDNELENVEFSEASAAKLHSGRICVGTKSGLYFFHPDNVKIKPLNAPIVFTRLQLFNQDVLIGVKGSPLKTHIDQTKHLRLSHKQNVFTLEYATLDMRTPQNIQYAYRLKGFDEDWNYVKNKRYATYTSLPPGTYTFIVRSTDSEGIWLQNERSMEIEILPSFWQSIWAKLLYVVLFILLFFVVFYIFITFYKLKHNVEMEQQMTDLKLRFFTDISHELRTPLTLISLPVDNLLNEKDLEPEVKEQLSLIRRNLDRVMRLINQILDFRKVQNNKMRLRVEETDFGAFVRSCSEDFVEIATEKKISFQVVNESPGVMVWIDRDRFDSIISNLLSNAFKFTPAGKSITIKASTESGLAVLTVSDEGVGISQDKIGAIFDRFFSEPLRSITQKSTGIGLNLVKKLVDLHHAVITVDSEVNKGSVFQVKFPLGIDHFNEDVDIILSDKAIPEEKKELSANEQVFPEREITENVRQTILIVEDNDELRHFLKSNLKKKYHVEEAENGLLGWQKAQELIPDFIITDLLMPEINGLELTEKIKNDERTSHIPVILLTAVTDMESKLTGMKVGADDYITKPFSAAFLNARIENLISQRNKLQKFYRSQLFSQSLGATFEPLESPSPEENFLQNLMHIMHENLENYELNIDFLASELGMSRTVFFNKLKSLTGFSPVEFVREVRLQRASEYVLNTELTFSEIAYKVGFEDPRYFSRCFKQKFGKTPSEYRGG